MKIGNDAPNIQGKNIPRFSFQGLKTFSFNPLIGLKCFALLETSVILFLAAVAESIPTILKKGCSTLSSDEGSREIVFVVEEHDNGQVTVLVP